jgi:hypothetical protein
LATCAQSFAHIATYHLQLSDSSGFGSGGTSIPVTVLPSSDSSCYNASNNVQVDWFFNIDPTGGLTQCSSSRIWWEPSTVNGYVPPSVCNRPAPAASSNQFSRHGMHCLAERSILSALSQVVTPSLFLRVHFPVTTRLELVSHGLSTSLVGPMSSSSGAMAEGWDPAAALHLLFHTQGTPVV